MRSAVPLPVAAEQQHSREDRGEPVLGDPSKLRELAAWYREFAERAGNPAIWEARLRMAEELETEADHIAGIERAGPLQEPRLRKPTRVRTSS